MCHCYLSPTVLQYPIFPACTARTCFGRCITAKVTQADRKLACNFVCEARFLTTNASAPARKASRRLIFRQILCFFTRICVLNPIPSFSSLQRAIRQTGAALHPSRNVGCSDCESRLPQRGLVCSRNFAMSDLRD